MEDSQITRREVIDNLLEAIIILDKEFRVTDINQSVCTNFHIEKESIIGLLVLDLIPEWDKIIENFKGVENISKYETKIKERSYNLRVSIIHDKDKKPSGYVLFLEKISADQQAKSKSEITQKEYHAILDTLQDFYFEADIKGMITYANHAFVKELGNSDKAEVIGKNFRFFTDRISVRDIFEKFKLIYDTKQPADPFEYFYHRKDGSPMVGEAYISPNIEDGEVIGTRGFIRNITARVHAEKEIAEQKDLLNSLLQQSPIAMVINDLDNKISIVNPAFENLFGYSQEESLGKDLDDILSKPEILDEMKELTDLVKSGHVFEVGQRKRKDGLLVDVEMFAAPLFVRGEKFGFLVFYIDISERLKTEADLEKTQSTFYATLDTLTDPYFEADPRGVITYANLGFVKTVGYGSRNNVIGIHFRHLSMRSEIRKVYQNFKVVYETKRPAPPFEYKFRVNDDLRIGDAYISPIIEKGEVIGTRGIIRDITDRVKAEKLLRETRDAAEHRAEELATINRISEIVSHSLDLGSILQSVCEELTTIFEIRNAEIGLLNKEQLGLDIIAFHSIDPEEERALGMVLPLKGNTSSQEVIKSKKTVISKDDRTDPSTTSVQDVSKERGTKAIMIVPLMARGKAIGTIGMPALKLDHVFTKDEIELAETVASQIAAAVENARLHSQTEIALDVAESDLEIGRQIQSGFFPEFLPEIPGWEISTHFQAARQVAGDFYDIFQLKNSNFTAFIIADVCDKGVGAALFMVLFRSLLRAFSEREIEIDNLQEHLLDIIVNTNKFISEIHGKSNMFATIFVGILDPDSGILNYVNGGHDSPVVLDNTGNVIHRLTPTGPAVGLFPDLEFSVAEIQLNKGDILFGFTDGTTDARDQTGKFFTEERLLETLNSPWSSAFSMLFELNSAVQEHIGEQDQYDDITQFSLRRKITADENIHTFNRKAVLENLEELRDFAEEVAINVGLNHEHAFAFKLAAEEVINNVIQYGYQDQEPGIISLSFECDKEKAILTIMDDGMYFSPDKAEAPDIEADWSERKIGGLGIYIVKELMDNVSYTKIGENKNMFVLEKELK